MTMGCESLDDEEEEGECWLGLGEDAVSSTLPSLAIERVGKFAGPEVEFRFVETVGPSCSVLHEGCEASLLSSAR